MIEQTATEVQQRAQSALMESPIYVLRQLQVEQDDDLLVLSGRVDTYYHKQLAQELVRSVGGGMKVVNSVKVEYGDSQAALRRSK